MQPDATAGESEAQQVRIVAVASGLLVKHAHLGISSVYLPAIDNTEIIHTVHQRPTPMIPATNGLGARR